MRRSSSKSRHADRRVRAGPAASGGLAAGPSSLLPGVLLIGVVGVVVAVHWPVLSAKAISFDDKQYLTENYLVQHPSWASGKRFLGEVFEPSTVAGYYQPLTMISLMLDYAIGGRPDNLRAFHRTSLALHVVNTALVVVLLYTLFGNPWVAAMAGLLFGLHPMTVEAIAWVGERKTVLAAFFTLGSLLSYVWYAQAGHWRWYALALVALVLALLSKPTSTPLPVLLLLLDFWPLRRLSNRALLEKVPFLVIGAASAVITYISQSRTGGAVAPGEYPLMRIPLTFCYDSVFYLYRIVWPLKLSSHYPIPAPFNLSNPAVLAGVIGTCLLVPVLLISLRRTRALLTGWLFFFVAILPTMGIIGFTNVIASDKYAYLPAVGLLLALAAGLAWLVGGAPQRREDTLRRWGIGAVVLILCGLEGVATRSCLAHWRDSETLARYMLRLTPDVAVLHHYMATVLVDQEKLDEAVAEYTEAIRLSPTFAEAHDSLGRVLVRQGRIDEAIGRYAEAVRLAPTFSEAHDNLAVALSKRGRFDEAVVHHIEALRLKPAFPVAHNNFAVTLVRQGRIDEAIAQYAEALQFSPAFVEAHNNVANALLKQGRLDEAITHYREALRLKPAFPEAHNNLANALLRQGRLDDAITHYRDALRLRPAFPEAHYSLASVYARQGKLDEAAGHYRNAIAINPAMAGAHRGLAAVLERQGKADEAMREYQQALRLNPQDGELRQRFGGGSPR